ncbi:16S rRNA (cytidine1402-2'-O)-methyltransferase [Mycoplasmopsis mustelae]|uniref:Ribosomal RNA small subunit methyltransferase I n=1 Tax=Mycoplasmopsis mustelae TaxID=171289 RepID=A0A4R7UDC2_9BACT|nr:16S rRNA (cytidine(1402)-2'-O)-methyltransferase [Mycoplasmopsis mustelae]TDV23565.1 16S rRNA (cytidine1402-2'-O)-methyltransferase [Mycoplasmopsis mustelae]
MSKLYIVGTPIGNLSDITYRAVETLQKVDVIACEDTRVTIKLLEKYHITKKKLITNNIVNEKNVVKELLNYLLNNKSVAVVSDAGMPLVADPGFNIINLARQNNIEIEIIPGVSAAITAFVGSGFSHNFTFLGFIKDKSQQRKNQLKTLTEGTYIFFVSPHKLISTISDIYEIFKDEVNICLAKELTKIYEQWFFEKPSTLLKILEQCSTIKGEYTLVLNIAKVKHIKINKYAKNK